MTPEQETLFRTVVLPLCTGLLCAGFAIFVPASFTGFRGVIGTVAVIFGGLLVYQLERGWPAFPPARSLHWLFPLGYAGATAAIISTLVSAFSRKTNVTLQVVFCVLLAGLVVWAHALRGGKWQTDTEVWLVIVGTIVGFWLSFSVVEKELEGRLGRLVLSGVLGCLAVVLMLTRSALLAQIAAGAACAMLGLSLTNRAMPGAAAFAAAPLAAFLGLQGRVFSRTENLELLLLAWGAMGLVIATLLPLKHSSRLMILAKAGCAMLIPFATVIYVMWRVRPWENSFL